MKYKPKLKLLALLTTIQSLLQRAMAQVPTDTGHHLFRDKVAVKARRIWRIPINEQGRELVRVDNTATGNLRYGTWQRANGQKSFPEVSQIYSWDKEDGTPVGNFNGPYYSMYKNDMGKYGWWRVTGTRGDDILNPYSIFNGGTNNRWARVRARIDSLTGECSHKMHYRAPYLIIPCYTQNSLHNTLTQPMVYDYYITIHDGDTSTAMPNADNDYWPISDQNYMNHTASDRGVDQNGHGIAGLSVNMNQRLHTTSIRWVRDPNLSGPNNQQTWWTLIWNGPYQGQLSQANRQPNGGAASLGAPAIQDANILYFRPFNDFAYLKTCRLPGHFGNLRVIEDIVQPDPQNTDGDQARLFFVWLQTNGGGTRHRISRCDISNDINLDPRIPPWGVSNVDCLANCVDVPVGNWGGTGIGSFSLGGLKYVPRNYNGGTANMDYIIGINQDATGGGAGNIFRCAINRDTSAISGCVSTASCPEQAGRNHFGYFSECRSAAGAAPCGIYYMGLNRALSGTATGNVADLMNRVYCADVIKFTGTQPLLYRRHFTGASAYDVSSTIQTGVDSVGTSLGINSYQEFYVYNSAEAQPTATNQMTTWTAKTGRLYDRERANSFYDYSVTGRVVRIQDANAAEGNYPMTGYLNQSYALPFRRRDWRGNALKVTPVGSQVNHSILHVNDVHMDNTEDWRFRDQFPMGAESLRVRRDFDNSGNHHLEVTDCWMGQHNIVTLNCSFTGARHPIGATEHIKRVWWNEESITTLTTESIPSGGTNATPQRERSRLYCYRKRDNTWSAHDFGQNTNNGALDTGVVEFIDVAEHEGDLFVAYKMWHHNFVTRPIHVARAPGMNVGPGSWTRTGMSSVPVYTYNPNGHPNGRGAFSDQRFFPLEDDSCVSGFNFVRDTSLKLRYLLDCNRVANSRDGADPANNQWGQTKWIGDHHVFDNPHVQSYNTVWNITLRPSETSNTDYLGDDYEYGCATSEYVFMFDTTTANGWTVAAVHIRDHSMRFFDLSTFDITGIQNMVCVGDYAVISATSNPVSTPSAIIILYGTMLEDARRRIHSIERYPGSITSLSPVVIDDKIWVRFVMNNRPYYRVAYLDGPIVVYNSTRTQWTNDQFISHTNGFNPANTTKTDVTFLWGNNIVNMTNITRTNFNSGTYNLDQISNITGHVYGANLNGVNANLGAIRQRVYFERDFSDVRRTRRVLDGIGTGTDPALTDNERRYTEMKVKGTRMCRLSADQGSTRFHYYNNPFNSLRNYRVGYECEHLDFSIDQNTTTINHDRMYWGTVCQETHFKEVRIFRLSQSGTANAYDGGGKIVHNDDIHRFSMDHISYQHHLLGFYNKNEGLLNLSIYNLHTGITAGDANHHNNIPGPVQSIIRQNGKLFFSSKIFQTKNFFKKKK